MLFCQDWRERIKAENPDANFGLSFSFLQVVIDVAEGLRFGAGELGKLLLAKWKDLDVEEKKVGLNGLGLHVFFYRFEHTCVLPVPMFSGLSC
jgi:hypothetical protein